MRLHIHWELSACNSKVTGIWASGLWLVCPGEQSIWRAQTTWQPDQDALSWYIQSLRIDIGKTSIQIIMKHNTLTWIHTCSYLNGRSTRPRLRLKQYVYDVPYRPGLIYQVSDAISKILFLPDTSEQNYKLKNSKVWNQPCRLGAARWSGRYQILHLWKMFFITISVLSWSPTISNTHGSDNLHNVFNANSWILKTKELQKLGHFAV